MDYQEHTIDEAIVPVHPATVSATIDILDEAIAESEVAAETVANRDTSEWMYRERVDYLMYLRGQIQMAEALCEWGYVQAAVAEVEEMAA